MKGLTPALFWEHKGELLAASQEEMTETIRCVVDKGKPSASEASAPKLDEWKKPPSAITRVDGLLAITCVADMPDWAFQKRKIPDSRRMDVKTLPCIVIRTNGEIKVPSFKEISPSILWVSLPTDKKASGRAFKASLSRCLDFVEAHLRDGRTVCVACETGKDLSAGITVAALQCFFSDDGSLDLKRRERGNMQGESSRIASQHLFIPDTTCRSEQGNTSNETRVDYSEQASGESISRNIETRK